MGGKHLARWAIPALLAVVTACGSPVAPTPAGPGPDSVPGSVNAELGADFTLAAGATAHLDDDRLTVLFRGVSNDSRCPEEPDIRCVWEGDATIALTVTSNGTAAEHDLKVQPPGNELALDGYRIHLVALRPGGSTQTIPQSEYRVDLRVSRT
ncbi:hypothetical protein [Nocardia sp. NPDC127526]|uniref:hypothetical protein n=1 Tax=Nocardia sp. NPDC127526 TaxID=3345393 RepID=UPI00363F9A96